MSVSTIEFQVLGVPIPKGRPKFRRLGSFVTAYTPAKTKKAEAVIAKAFKERFPHFQLPDSDKVMLRVIFFMPIPKSTSKIRRKQMIEKSEYHTKKPDLDNLVKLVQDALNGVAWKDDSHIVFTQAIKCYGETPKTDIEIDYVI